MSDIRVIKNITTCLSAAAATGVGTTTLVADFQYVVVQLSAALNSTLTVKFQGSVSETAPTFSSAQSGTNHWDYISVVDMQDAAAIAGDTGVTLDNTTVAVNTRQYLVNTRALRWFNMEVTAYTDGNVTTNVVGFNNA